MERAALKAKLGDIENAQEIIEFVMNENGKDIEATKAKAREEFKDYETLKAQVAEKTELLKKYDKDGELYVDKDEYAKLVKFKADAERNAVNESKTKTITDFLKENKANDKAIKLLVKALNIDEIELEEKDGKTLVKDGENILNGLKKDYGDFFTQEETGGGKGLNPNQSSQNSKPEAKDLTAALKEQYE